MLLLRRLLDEHHAHHAEADAAADAPDAETDASADRSPEGLNIAALFCVPEGGLDGSYKRGALSATVFTCATTLPTLSRVARSHHPR